MLICSSMLCRAQSMDVYWAPGLTLSCAQVVSKSPNVISTGRLAPQFQIGNVGLRFSPFKNPGHSLDFDFLIWHTVVAQTKYKAYFADQLFENGVSSSTMIYNGFSLGYSYNFQLSPRWRFYPMAKFNFIFTPPMSGGTSSSPYYDITNPLTNEIYTVRDIDKTIALNISPADVTLSLGARFTYHTKKRFFLLFGVQYYRGFRDQIFNNIRLEDTNGNELVYVNTKSKNSNLTIEFGFGGRIPLPKRKDKK